MSEPPCQPRSVVLVGKLQINMVILVYKTRCCSSIYLTCLACLLCSFFCIHSVYSFGGVQLRYNINNCDCRTSVIDTYQSGLNSYLSFCEQHNININPTPDTLSLFITYMAQQMGPSGKLISIQTILSYLSGITNLLEPEYPAVHQARNHPIVFQTLCGVEKLVGQPLKQKLLVKDNHL